FALQIWYPFLERSTDFVVVRALTVQPTCVDGLAENRRFPQCKGRIPRKSRDIEARTLRIVFDQLFPVPITWLPGNGRPLHNRRCCFCASVCCDHITQISQRIAKCGHLPVEYRIHSEREIRREHEVSEPEVPMDR